MLHFPKRPFFFSLPKKKRSKKSSPLALWILGKATDTPATAKIYVPGATAEKKAGAPKNGCFHHLPALSGARNFSFRPPLHPCFPENPYRMRNRKYQPIKQTCITPLKKNLNK